MTLLLALAACTDSKPEGRADPTPPLDTPTDATDATDTDGDPPDAEGCDVVPVTLDGAVGFPSLDAALAAASAGSELLLCPGEFVGRFEATVPVRIVSRTGAADTFLSGSGGTTLSVPGGSEIVGLTIRGGSGPLGGGILLTGTGSLLVEDSVITGNHAERGAGISVGPGGIATLVRTEVRDNTATEGGGGVAVGVGGVLELTEGSSVLHNEAKWFGGGVWLDGAALIGGLVSDNELTRDFDELFEDYLYFDTYYDIPLSSLLPVPVVGGSGVATTGVSSIVGAEVAGNRGDGGVSVFEGEAVLADVSIHDNQGLLGGGLLAAEGVVSLEGSTELAGNRALRGGGAAVFGASLSGGVVRDNTAEDAGGIWLTNAVLSEVTIRDNAASSVGGGAYSEGWSELVSVTLRGNDADDGGGIATQEPSNSPDEHHLSMRDCTVEANTARYGGGVAAYSSADLVDTRVIDNAADTVGGGLWLYIVPEEGGPLPEPWLVVTLSGGEVLRNEAASGGGVSFELGLLSADGVDFGDGLDDNTPSDVSLGAASYTGYGAGATFACDPQQCTPAP